MDKPSHNTTDSVGKAFKPFASLINTVNAVINQLFDISGNAEYNKKICNVFLDRVDVAKIHIKNLERRKEENEYLFRDVDYYKHFVRFTTILTEIKTFLNDITHLLGYNKYNSAKNFEEMFGKLTREIDTTMENLKFKMTIAPEEQKKKDQQNFKEDHEDMKKFWRSIGGGIVDDNQQMNTSLRLAITIKARVESIDNQDDSIKAIQIPPNMLQDPKYKKSSDFRGERPYYIRKEILKGDIEVACRDIIIHDLSANEYQKIQKQLFILEKLRDSKNILRFYGLSTVDDVSTVMVLEWAEMGNLDNVYNNYVISWPDKVSIALGICRGLVFLHACKILHRDIRCGNIMMTKEKEPKIANFIRNTKRLENSTIIVHWLAPEMLSPKPSYNFKCEIFSFGMLLWELGFERIPYDKWDIPKIREYVLSSKRELVTYDDDDEKMLKLQEEYSNIFIG
ncbi:14188_t:CDS:2, partial [Entrophospora sp. SA101]